MRILKMSERKRKEKKSGAIVVVIDDNLMDFKDFKERRNWRG
jgi:predicted secreted acid phosphatase